MNKQTIYTRGQVVQFKDPHTAQERLCFFQVIEDRGDRVLVSPLMTSFADWQIRPTDVFMKSDIKPIDRAAKKYL